MSNKQQSIKLYTEEQVRKMLEVCREFAEYGGESGIDAQQYYTYTFGGNK